MGSRHQGSPIEASRLSNRTPEHKTKNGIRVLVQAAADRTRVRLASAGTCRSTRASSFFCENCQKGFNERTNYDQHMAKHEGRSSYFACQVCNKNSSVNINCVTTCLKRMSSSTTPATFVEKDSTASRVTKNTKKRTLSKFCKRPVATVWSVV